MRLRLYSPLSIRLAAMLLALTISVVGCQTTKTPISATSFVEVATICEAFPNITYSRQDTPETRRQIVGFNAARDALCK